MRRILRPRPRPGAINRPAGRAEAEWVWACFRRRPIQLKQGLESASLWSSGKARSEPR